VPVSGGSPRQVTTSEGAKTPSDCTRDGNRIFFSVERAENRETPVIVALERRGDDGALIETELGPGEGGRWSPDETHIAFVSTRDSGCDLYVTEAGSDSAERVTTPRPASLGLIGLRLGST